MADNTMQPRALSLSTLETIKNAYSSPSACIHANWCRIPMAIVIAIGLLILFTCFCCWAQCMSCCCCAGSRRRKSNSVFDAESNRAAAGVPRADTFAYSRDLPAMPSYKLNDLKKPTYAVIGDDGSVSTEDPDAKVDADNASLNNEKQSNFQAPAFGGQSQYQYNRPADPFASSQDSLHRPQGARPYQQARDLSPTKRSGLGQYPPHDLSPSKRGQYPTFGSNPDLYGTSGKTGYQRVPAPALPSPPIYNSYRDQNRYYSDRPGGSKPPSPSRRDPYGWPDPLDRPYPAQ